MKRFAYVLAAVMLVAPIGVSVYEGEFYTGNCSPWLLLKGWLGASRDISACRMITLTADIPSIALWLGSVAAVVLFQYQRSLMTGLSAHVVSSGIVDTHPIEFSYTIDTNKEIRRATVIFGFMLVIGYFLYVHTRDDFAYAQYLGNEFKLKSYGNWWALSGASPWLWVIIGATGATVASMHATMNAQFTRMIWKAGRNSGLQFKYVPKWMSDCHGWEPLRSMWYSVIAGSVVFIASFTAVSYLVIGGADTPALLAVVTVVILTGGVLINAAMIVLIYVFVRRWFINATDVFRATLSTKLNACEAGSSVRDTLKLISYRIEAQEFQSVSSFPFSSRWRLVPAALAFLITNFAVIGALIGWATGTT